VRKEKIYCRYSRALSIAKQLCWFISQIDGVVKVGLFGSLALKKPVVGDIDIVIFLKSRKIPKVLLEKYDIFSEDSNGYYRYCVDQIKHLLKLQGEVRVGKVDAAMALINSYDIRVDTLLLPMNPTNGYLSDFINCGRGDFNFLPHIVKVLRVYRPISNDFVKLRLPWASKVEKLHKDIKRESGYD
jgi:hypothetical protein